MVLTFRLPLLRVFDRYQDARGEARRAEGHYRGSVQIGKRRNDKLIEADMEQSFALRSARHRGKAFVAWLSR